MSNPLFFGFIAGCVIVVFSILLWVWVDYKERQFKKLPLREQLQGQDSPYRKDLVLAWQVNNVMISGGYIPYISYNVDTGHWTVRFDYKEDSFFASSHSISEAICGAAVKALFWHEILHGGLY